MASLKHLKASSGAGNAVIAHITNVRAIGQNEIKCDALTDWSDFFLASSGKLLGDGSIDQSTVTEFEGHKSGSSIIIDTYCPGYSDMGNTTDQIVVIKPTTTWSNTLNNLIAVEHNDDGTLKDNSVTASKIDFSGFVAAKRTTVSGETSMTTGVYKSANLSLTSGVTYMVHCSLHWASAGGGNKLLAFRVGGTIIDDHRIEGTIQTNMTFIGAYTPSTTGNVQFDISVSNVSGTATGTLATVRYNALPIMTTAAIA